MKRRHRCIVIGLSVLIAVSVQAAPASSQQAVGRPPQYRYRAEQIPAAHAEEPRLAQVSSAKARDYLRTGVRLWSQQRKCVSCHTHGVYAITRPAMSEVWGKPDDELRRFLVAQLAKVGAGEGLNNSTPGQLAYLARGLAEWDATFTPDQTSAATNEALTRMLAIESQEGSVPAANRWPPLNSDAFHASIMGWMAIHTAPGWRASPQALSQADRIARLGDYLFTRPPQHDHQRLLLLWAETRTPGRLSDAQRRDWMERIWRLQRPDGGWSTRSFASADQLGRGPKAAKLKREPNHDNPPSDGYQTGLVIVVLRDLGAAADDPRIAKGVAWLKANQRVSGRWWTPSLNVDSRFHYSTFSGSAYAALALAKCDQLADE